MGLRPAGTFPYRAFETTATLNGVALRQYGQGAPLVFIPGMTGGGQATLDLAIGCAERAAAARRPYRLVLLDYTDEAHERVEDLQETAVTLVRRAIGDEPCLVWCESLGHLVAPPARFDAALRVARRVMISPFTRIPGFRLGLGLVLMALSPPPLYRLAMKPAGRVMFGPCGDRPDHVFFDAVASVPLPMSKRRSRWLWNRDFTPWFTSSSTTPVPTGVWMGAKDRLIHVGEQARFFGQLGERPGSRFTLVAGGGHVVTDTRLSEVLLSQIAEWMLT